MSSRPALATLCPDQPTANDLADGFVSHVLQWAAQTGAPAGSLAVLAAAARQVSLATQNGHVCAQVDDLAILFPAQSVAELSRCLLTSGMVASAGEAPILPLLLDRGGRLYLHRYFDYEHRLAANLRQRAEHPPLAQNEDLRQRLDSLFADNAPRLGGRPDWQKIATALAWRGKLTIISGGPGTGKTTTVVALLACLLAENHQLRVALAAPTGKAAARMLDAVRKRAGALPPALQALLPRESYTVHRLLGVTPDRGHFRHHTDNPLPIDALIVDEASMLDLALACRLCEAVPPDARLVLLGDKDQLAAVEAGAVFAEISADPTLTAACVAELSALTSTPAARIRLPLASTPTQAPLADCVVWFSESHRFASSSGIGRLAADINAGRGGEACAWLATNDDSSVSWLADGSADLAPTTRQAMLDGYRPYLETLARVDLVTQRDEVFAAFDRFRVLGALRETARGVDAINRRLGQHAQRSTGTSAAAEIHSPWYPGRPVMVLRNDYLLKLFNGDIGICLPDEGGHLMVWFPEHDAGFRPIAPIRLPEHDTAFAMTVHKSQGSEFESVLLLLPERPHRVLTRELFYTGVTRASKRVSVVGSQEVLVSACANRTRRHSGLIARLGEVAG